MPICPLCKEEIKDNAIKCKHCHSFLVPIYELPQAVEKKENDSKTTKYIVENDLIRFGKFGFFLLGLFIIVGATIWGFDLKKISEEEKKIADEQSVSKDKIERLGVNISSEQGLLIKTQSELDNHRASLKITYDALEVFKNQFEKDKNDAQQKTEQNMLLLNKTQASLNSAVKQSAEYSKSAQAILDSIKGLKQKADLIVNDIGHLDQLHKDLEKGTDIHQNQLAFSIITGIPISIDGNSFGCLGYFLKNSNNEVFAVCSSPIFPRYGSSPKKVFSVNKDRSIDSSSPIGETYLEIPGQFVGIVKLRNDIEGHNRYYTFTGSKKINGVRTVNDADVLRKTSVFVSGLDGEISRGSIWNIGVSINFQTDAGIVEISDLITTNLRTHKGNAGNVLLDENGFALGILIGSTAEYSYFYPLVNIMNAFALTPVAD